MHCEFEVQPRKKWYICSWHFDNLKNDQLFVKVSLRMHKTANKYDDADDW